MSRATAFSVAEELGWPDTDRAEYVAVAKLQADAFITQDAELARAVSSMLTVAHFDDLTRA